MKTICLHSLLRVWFHHACMESKTETWYRDDVEPKHDDRSSLTTCKLICLRDDGNLNLTEALKAYCWWGSLQRFMKLPLPSGWGTKSWTPAGNLYQKNHQTVNTYFKSSFRWRFLNLLPLTSLLTNGGVILCCYSKVTYCMFKH